MNHSIVAGGVREASACVCVCALIIVVCVCHIIINTVNVCVCVCHKRINTVNIQMNVYPLQCDLTMHNQRSRTDHPGV